MFGSSLWFSVSLARMALFPLSWNPRWRPAAFVLYSDGSNHLGTYGGDMRFMGAM